MGSLPITGSPHNGTLEAPLPPVRGFFFFGAWSWVDCLTKRNPAAVERAGSLSADQCCVGAIRVPNHRHRFNPQQDRVFLVGFGRRPIFVSSR